METELSTNLVEDVILRTCFSCKRMPDDANLVLEEKVVITDCEEYKKRVPCTKASTCKRYIQKDIGGTQ